MKHLEIQLKKDHLSISKLALGTDYFGTNVPDEKAFRLMDMFTDAGGNCLDTARVYAAWLPGGEGISEKTIGKWMKLRGNRNSILISSKGGHPPLSQMNASRLSAKEVESDLDESLKALGVDTIDLYWLHRDEVKRPVEDILETMNRLVEKGKIRAFGCSNWRSDRIEAAQKAARENGVESFCSSQIQWSLATSTPDAHEDPTIVCMDEAEYAWYKENSFPVFAYSSQAKGFFARAAAQGLDAINQKANARFNTPVNIARLHRVSEYAAQQGLTPTAAALGYILSNPVPSVAIVGCKNEAQMADTLTAVDVSLSYETVEWLLKGAVTT